MKMQSGVKATGSLKIVRTDSTGKVVEERNIPNLVVTDGKEYIASRMVGTADTVMSHMALGDDSTSPLAGDAALASELGRVSLSDFSATSNTVTATATFGAGTATGTLKEAGIFNDGSAGTMLCRTTFSDVNKASGDSVAITWTITVS